MKTIFDKESGSLYINLWVKSIIDFTYCCDPLKIKQECINFDISLDFRVIWIEIISNDFLDTPLISFHQDLKETKIIFEKNKVFYEYNNNNILYDEKNTLFWRIKIGFDINDKIVYIKIKNKVKK